MNDFMMVAEYFWKLLSDLFGHLFSVHWSLGVIIGLIFTWGLIYFCKLAVICALIYWIVTAFIAERYFLCGLGIMVFFVVFFPRQTTDEKKTDSSSEPPVPPSQSPEISELKNDDSPDARAKC
jgi:hypothetical protein